MKSSLLDSDGNTLMYLQMKSSLCHVWSNMYYALGGELRHKFDGTQF